VLSLPFLAELLAHSGWQPWHSDTKSPCSWQENLGLSVMDFIVVIPPIGQAFQYWTTIKGALIIADPLFNIAIASVISVVAGAVGRPGRQYNRNLILPYGGGNWEDRTS
jgi:hypothetical protein